MGIGDPVGYIHGESVIDANGKHWVDGIQTDHASEVGNLAI
jgi:hypothetical protein